MYSIIDTKPSSGEVATKAHVWKDATMKNYDIWETVPKPTVESTIDSMHAMVEEVFLEQESTPLRFWKFEMKRK